MQNSDPQVWSITAMRVVSQMCGVCFQNFLGERVLHGLTTHLGHHQFLGVDYAQGYGIANPVQLLEKQQSTLEGQATLAASIQERNGFRSP